MLLRSNIKGSMWAKLEDVDKYLLSGYKMDTRVTASDLNFLQKVNIVKGKDGIWRIKCIRKSDNAIVWVTWEEFNVFKYTRC